MKGLEMRTGSLEERKKDKIKVHSPPCPKHACISAYPIRASPSPRLLLFLSSLPMLCLGHAIMKLAIHVVELEQCLQRSSSRRPQG